MPWFKFGAREFLKYVLVTRLCGLKHSNNIVQNRERERERGKERERGREREGAKEREREEI